MSAKTEPVKAVIFDLDGLLVDSEPLWREAERQVFGSLGLVFSPADLAATTGIRLDEVVRIRYRQQPWPEPTLADVEEAILAVLADLIAERGQAMPGALQAVEHAASLALPLALASSSPTKVIMAQLEKLDLVKAFAVIRSAEHEEHGKPHPAVYLRTAEDLGIAARQCLAFEDSLPGLIAAKAANMQALVVPSDEDASHPGFGLADHRLRSLSDLDANMWDRLLGA